MLNNFCSCPTDCTTTFTIPALPTGCDLLPESSEILAVIILPIDVSPPVDWTDAAQWAAIISNSDTSNTFGKIIKGIGSIPVPDKTVTTLAAGVQVTTQKTYTLSHLVPSLKDDLLRDFLVQMQCGNTDFTFWYLTNDDRLFGGSTGIRPNFSDADLPLESGRESNEQGTLLLSWETRGCDPPRETVANLIETIEATIPIYPVMGFGSNQVFGFGTGSEVFIGG